VEDGRDDEDETDDDDDDEDEGVKTDRSEMMAIKLVVVDVEGALKRLKPDSAE
jgi:hypothetical protein